MKKKILTLALLGMLAVGSIAPMTAKASETWNYGFDSFAMQNYNNYYNSSYSHYGTITKNYVTYRGLTASAGYWSCLRVDYTGPYYVTYGKYTI